MFSRVPGLSSTCSKCRSRLSQVQVTEIASIISIRPSARRWQSVAATHTDDGSNLAQPIANNDSSAQERVSELSIQDSDNQIYKKDDENRKPTRFRRWRPHQAEGLGVSVLGKPAEVLILPPRKRKINDLLPKEDENEKKASLQGSLDSELKPVSMADVMKNIDSLKEELGKDKQAFSVAEWKDSTRRLAQGFTKSQLQEYLRVATGLDGSERGAPDISSAINSKREMAAQIMTQAWHWKSADTPKVTPHAQLKVATQSIAIPAAKLGYIMLHEKERLGQLSKTLDVQIDVWKKRREIRLKGKTAAVNNAHTRLRQLKKTIQEAELEIPKRIQEFLGDESKSAAVLSDLMQKHKVFISKNANTLNVVGIAKAGVDVVLRDLMLMSGSFDRVTPFSFCWEYGDERATHAPFYVDDSPQSLAQDTAPFRHVSPCAISHVEGTALSDGRKVRRLAEKLLKSDRLNQNKLSQFAVAPGTLSHDYVADLGQVLFNTTKGKADIISLPSQDSSIADTTVIVQQALLPQVLAKKQFELVGEKRASGHNIKIKRPQPFLLNLRLVPETQSAGYPLLEILLRGDDAERGLRQQLRIKRVFAVLDQWQHSILLPNQSLDIIMSRHSKVDLLALDGKKPVQAYLDILQQLGSLLEHAQASDQTQLPPIWRLNVSPLFKKPVISSPAISQPPTLTLSPEQKGSNHKSTLAKTLDKTSPTTYILEPPEYLDITSYAFTSVSDRYVDHIVCHTEAMDKPRQRQVLRICEQPLSELLDDTTITEGSKASSMVERQRWFRQSITAAYDITTMIREAEQTAGQAVGTNRSVNDVL